MIPASFVYKRARTLDEAFELLAGGGDEAKYLAGGQSLLPLMKLRLAAPETLVDVGRLDGLRYIRDEGSHIAVGALTSHHQLATSELLARDLPLLAHAAAQVGDPQVRHRGTLGGSLAHADPAADLPAVILGLDATLLAHGPAGTREISAHEFFLGLFETALRPSELLTEIRVPKPRQAGWSYQKFTKRAIDWAIVGVAVQGDNVALVNMAQTPLRAGAVERALAAGAEPAEAAGHAADATSPSDDLNGSSGFREHLARVLVQRAIEESRRRL